MLSMPTKRRRAKDYAVSWLQVLLPDYYECKQRFSSVIGASSSVVIGWDKNSTVLRCTCTWRTTTCYNTISWHCEGVRVLLVDFQRQNFAKLNISRCMLHRAPRVVLNLYHNSVVFL